MKQKSTKELVRKALKNKPKWKPPKGYKYLKDIQIGNLIQLKNGTKAVLLTGTPGSFTADEEINQATTGAVGKVVEYDATNKLLYFIQTRFNDEGVDSNGNATAFSGTNVITGQDSSATGTPSSSSSTVNNVVIASGYSVPEIDADTGDVIYIENRTAITRASDQTENVKLIVEF